MVSKKWLLAVVGLCLTLVLQPLAAQDVAALKTGTDGFPWWNDRVFYEIFVRSFQDSDGDGIGDLQGIISKLDYLNDGNPNTKDDLGITGLWLMPIMESPSYHGYDVTDYMKVEPDYGTNEDFKQLVAEAHKRGIVVIVDLVVNHTSREHPWFIDSQTPGSEHDDWYRWDASETKPPQTGPWGQEVWYKLAGRWYYAVFWDGMPDLNLAHPVVTEAVDKIAQFWLDDMTADGFRMDGARYYVEDGSRLADSDSNLQWAAAFKAYAQSVKPDALVLGEVWTGSGDVARYIPNSFDLAFEFDLSIAMLDSARRGTNEAVTPVQLRTLGLYPQGQYAPFLTNHDQYRLMQDQGKDPNKVKVAASMLLTGAGVPFLYYGEEIGMIGGKPDECIRTPMQWDDTLPNASFMLDKNCRTNQDEYNVAVEDRDPDSLLNHYRALIHLRNDHAALRVGAFIPVASTAKELYSYIRRSSDETLLVVINLSKKEITDYGLSLEQSDLSGTQAGSLLMGEGEVANMEILDEGGFNNYKPLATVAPFSTTVIKLDPANSGE
ncbi:MAG: alpha-amylase [Chloroflexi bacterium]|nr:alpha-amylase [Chloroflexota bacterium]MCC6892159.1 alpha-amylase [Anaerolineae bacterium]